MHDVWLPRIVAVGLLFISVAAISGSTFLRSNEIDGSNLSGIANAAVGALAAFFAGVSLRQGPGGTTTKTITSPPDTTTTTSVDEN